MYNSFKRLLLCITGNYKFNCSVLQMLQYTMQQSVVYSGRVHAIFIAVLIYFSPGSCFLKVEGHRYQTLLGDPHYFYWKTSRRMPSRGTQRVVLKSTIYRFV